MTVATGPSTRDRGDLRKVGELCQKVKGDKNVYVKVGTLPNGAPKGEVLRLPTVKMGRY